MGKGVSDAVALAVAEGGTNGVQVGVGVRVVVGEIVGGDIVSIEMNVAVASKALVWVGVGVLVGARRIAIQPAQ